MALLKALQALLLAAFAASAHALGGSGGCGLPTYLFKVIEEGSPEALSVMVAQRVDSQLDRLDLSTRVRVKWSPASIREWKADAALRLVNGMTLCDSGPLIDRAVRAGNLETLKWLLDAGADPNGASTGRYPVTVFDRCPGPDHFDRSDRTQQAYRMLLARGADLNRSRAASRNALTECLSTNGIRRLLDLGIDRSPAGAHMPVKYAPLQDAIGPALFDRGLERVRALAEGGFDDLRGTKVEADLYKWCRRPALEARCRELQPLIRVSRSTWPASLEPGESRAGPEAVALRREACHFPELRGVEGLELAVVSVDRPRPTGLAFEGADREASLAEVFVNSPDHPVFLQLVADLSRVWSIRSTPGTRIVGVVVTTRNPVSEPSDLVGAVDDVPVLYGNCGVGVTWAREGRVAFGLAQPSGDGENPFSFGAVTKSYLALDGPVVVGDALDAQSRAALSKEPLLEPRTLRLEPFPRVAPVGGREALEDLVARRKLAHGTVVDALQWVTTMRSRGGWSGPPTPRLPAFDGSYVVNDSIRLPAGLRGADAPVFFVYSAGALSGDLGDSTVYYFPHDAGPDRREDVPASCVGPRC